MSPVSKTVITTAQLGRLPAPVVAWPVSPRAFADLARTWRSSGVWLSLWNARGECLEVDTEAGRFWTMLWSKGERFKKDLAAFAAAACDAESVHGNQDESRAAPAQPWQPDLEVMAAPVRCRQRTLGVVLGVVQSGQPGEAFTRLCSQCGLDRQTMIAAAKEAAGDRRHEAASVDMLRFTVEQTRTMETLSEEIAVLTQNLENTYEEQHLVYQVSGLMGLPQRPVAMLERVAKGLLEVSRASSLAFVLSEYAALPGAAAPAGDYAARPLSDRIVQVGPGAPDLTDLDRLAESLHLEEHHETGHRLLNDACSNADLAWAKGWLRHLVALPLRFEQRVLGVMLAINCQDEGDFTSVDVQLLRAVADRISAFLENQRLYDDLADLLMGLLHAVVNSIDAKDQYTCGHSERVAFISRSLAHMAGLSAIEAERVYLAGLLHDVGKIGVPDAILCKPGKLTAEEFQAMRRHPEIGAKILARVRQVADLMPGVLYHHERVDARGYPAGLAGKNVPLLGRIICLADCFDAMSTDRTYRAALPLPVVIAEIRKCAGTQFDPALAEAFLKLNLKGIMKEARQRCGGDPTIGHIGALNAVLKGSPITM